MEFMKKVILGLSLSIIAISASAYDARSYMLLPIDYSLADMQVSNIETTKKINASVTAKSELNMVYARYVDYFDVAGNLGAAYILLPYANNNGDIRMGGNVLKYEKMDGLGDVKLFLGLGVYNMPALSKEQFKSYNKDGLKAACSVMLTLPTGTYDKSNLFNIGSNQTSVKPECNINYTQDKFVIEFSTGLTAYSDNKEYTSTSKLSKDNLYHSEIHVSYNLTPKIWTGVDLFYAHGGKTYVNNIPGKDKQENLSAGLIMSYNISPGGYIKVNYQKTIDSPEYAPKQSYFGLAFQQLF
jgi:hypothetical protein